MGLEQCDRGNILRILSVHIIHRAGGLCHSDGNSTGVVNFYAVAYAQYHLLLLGKKRQCLRQVRMVIIRKCNNTGHSRAHLARLLCQWCRPYHHLQQCQKLFRRHMARFSAGKHTGRWPQLPTANLLKCQLCPRSVNIFLQYPCPLVY